ncbi:MAG: phosphoribosylanthranilate isomerase [Gaiellaceae bacterium]
MLVQVYGITTPEDGALVSSLRPDHVGVVLDEGIATWDSVAEEDLPQIREAVEGVTVVALSLAIEPGRILRTAELTQPGIVHLARAEAIGPERLAGLRKRLESELMLTVPVRGPESVELARVLARCCDYLLLDSADPASGVVGATGLVHDWALSRRIVEAVDIPVILAGGLGPENVVEAIRAVRPAGVDSETRTSRADDRRRKDPELVRRFIELARGSAEGAGTQRS